MCMILIMLCAWLKDNHPEAATQFISEPPSSVISSSSAGQSNCNSLITHFSKSSESSKILDELRCKDKKKRTETINSKTVVITDRDIRQEKADKEAKEAEKEQERSKKEGKRIGTRKCKEKKKGKRTKDTRY